MMRLKDELRLYPERTKKKIEAFTENYCALIIASLEDVTPEEAFLSLGRDKVFKFIRHRKYTVDDIYNMLQLRSDGKNLVEIAALYGISHKMVWQILLVYGRERKINE
jgi:hypothetical protein